MSALNWGLIQDGGAFESLMHSILYAEDAGTILFGRPGKDAGQDARSANGEIVYQAKYRQGLKIEDAVQLALSELAKIKDYRAATHPNQRHWEKAETWILVCNAVTNPNDWEKWQEAVLAFKAENLQAKYWGLETLEGKLAQFAHIRDVFFGGQNRVLIGLKEANDMLSKQFAAADSMENPAIGIEDNLAKVIEFASDERLRIQPVVGRGGMGKSRFLYESLLALAKDGWRVLWGLPETMARSPQWFQLLNGSQQTVVAIDGVDGLGFLKAVIEQLTPVERRNWKILVSVNSERASLISHLQANSLVAKPIQLKELNENNSKVLLRNSLRAHVDDSWLHSVYTYSKGIPGWLCIIAAKAKRKALGELPSTADAVAEGYVASCLGSLPEQDRNMAREVIRWLSLWKLIRVDLSDADSTVVAFFRRKGISRERLIEVLRGLVASGLVLNRGIEKRVYAVEPEIIREHILASWILTGEKDRPKFNDSGEQIVQELIKGKIPEATAVIETLAFVKSTRLSDSDGHSLMRPIFDSLRTLVKNGTIIEQHQVLDLVLKAGMVDQESALEVITAIRTTPKDSISREEGFWGSVEYTHRELISKLPWILFQIAEQVSDPLVAKRVLGEFKKLMFDAGTDDEPEIAKRPDALIRRLLRQTKNWTTFSAPALEIIKSDVLIPDAWAFLRPLIESILNPEKEFLSWTATWTVSFATKMPVPASEEWLQIMELREFLFSSLNRAAPPECHCLIWQSLAASHHDFHRLLMHRKVPPAYIPDYRGVVVADLERCLALLSQSRCPLTLEKATRAREMWAWYLDHSDETDLVELATKCETIFDSLSRWRLHHFFKFDYDEKLAPETQHVATILKAAKDVSEIDDFFNEATRYLTANGSLKDGAHFSRMSDLAQASIESISLDTSDHPSALSQYFRSKIAGGDTSDALPWAFATAISKLLLLRSKSRGDSTLVQRLLNLTESKEELLLSLYGNVHPDTVGNLDLAEFRLISAKERRFASIDYFRLLGAFSYRYFAEAKPLLEEHMQKTGPDKSKSQLIAVFISNLYLAALRYRIAPPGRVLEWVMDQIIEHNLNGRLFDVHGLTWLRDRCAFKMPISDFLRLLKARIALEGRARSTDADFLLMPFDFSTEEWVAFDPQKPVDVQAFHALCGLIMEKGFIPSHELPRYVCELDPDGKNIETFIGGYLAKTPNLSARELSRLGYLVSGFGDSSSAWMNSAMLICKESEHLNRDEREMVYFGLSKKESGVYTSDIGEVPRHYLDAAESARRSFEREPKHSPLRGYREWSARCSEDALNREKARAEESDSR